jgi:hypothetical protein
MCASHEYVSEVGVVDGTLTDSAVFGVKTLLSMQLRRGAQVAVAWMIDDLIRVE